MPTLYLVSNSLGDDRDLPPRTKELLETADLILGEEHRTTSTLLKKLGISRSFEICNEHTSEEELEELGLKLAQTQLTCIISDSGSPGLEDPARRLVPIAWDMGVEVKSAPGPTAAIAALTSSGFQSSPFTFLGFLPREQKEREKEIKIYLGLGHTLVFYETPYRTKNLLESLAKLVPSDRRIFLSLGISTESEQNFRGTAKEVFLKAAKVPKLPPVFVIEEKKQKHYR
ncbi:16S rRNA (cytidine(1402)-2'-O)-methyltransferase [Leptospira idonii]|uniref:Methyltransferase n=1 Tax=Leptospira idonii TaxID=1193500 RepID=A0A4R9M7L5_9LEPT|nr:SAM-dependent methyltransferase [Leptospira idonii]TGN20598.1 methyltransferase [Leptospira idonii]